MSARREVEAEMARVVAEAEASGQDSMAAYRSAFPGAPDGPYWEAWCKWDDDREARWWEAVERTIDAETIKRAVALSAATR